MVKQISILGSTGSIGQSTLDVIRRHPDRFRVSALAAGTNIDLLYEQIDEFRPRYVSVATQRLAEQLSERTKHKIPVGWGDEGMIACAVETESDLFVSAVVGSRGLRSTLAAIEAGKDVAIANKESLVTAGHLVMERAKAKKVAILPMDSEHSAIFQCLNGESLNNVRKIILTASGGSFRDYDREQLKHVTVEQALKHPNWNMGAKITIDSATMMNKGLEVIEAHWLFEMDYNQIEVVIHPESIIHSLVEFQDGAVMAQLGTPDMRVPILYALSYPQRLKLNLEPLDLLKVGALHFRKPDFERYPCLRFAYECGRQKGSWPTVLNAANEKGVELFLQKRISFLEIEKLIECVLNEHKGIQFPDLEEIEEADRWARQQVLISISDSVSKGR